MRADKMPCFSLANEQNPRIDSIFAKFIAQPQATIIEEQTGSFNAPQNVDEKAAKADQLKTTQDALC